jgi:dTMP kinase
LPDVTLFLTLPPEVASQRAAYGTERYEKVEIQQRVREQFGRVGARMQEVHGGDAWRDIDASGSIEQIGAHIWEVVQSIGASDGKKRLWM